MPTTGEDMEMEREREWGGSTATTTATATATSALAFSSSGQAWPRSLYMLLRPRKEVLLSLLGLGIVVATLLWARVNATLILITSSNQSIPLPNIEASFARRISGAGFVGLLATANSLNACLPLKMAELKEPKFPAFLLIERGGCSFVTKVQYAQDAGYAAAIVFDNEDSQELVTMSGNGFGIEIPAVFISKEAGHLLSQFVNDKDAKLYMLPALETSAWSVLAISSISLLTFSAVLSTFFFVRRQRLRRASIRQHQDPVGLTTERIKALPVITIHQKEGEIPETCVICLEEYVPGDKLRALPCKHGFHIPCIDNWLVRSSFCPVCKRNAIDQEDELNSSESTSLLSAFAWQTGSSITPLNSLIGTSTIDRAARAPGSIC